MPLSALRGPIDHLRTIGDVLECPKRQLGTVLGQSGMSLSALRDMKAIVDVPECPKKHLGTVLGQLWMPVSALDT